MIKQKGFFSLFQLISIAVLLTALIFALKLITPYYNLSIVKRTVQNTLQESQGNLDLNKTDLQMNLFNRLNIQQQTIPYEKIVVKNGSSLGHWNVQINMITEIPLWKNAKVVLDLSIDESN